MTAKTIAGHTYHTSRDDYGRPQRTAWNLRGVVVTMPKTWTATRPNEKYLVNLWDGTGPSYFANLNVALAWHAANAETWVEHQARLA